MPNFLGSNPDVVLWIFLMIVFIIIESVTFNLLTIWFALGSLISLVCAFFGFPFGWQIAFFIISSFLLLIFTKPFIDKKLVIKKEPTNADRVLDEKGIVIEDIDNIKGTGQVKVLNQVWSAISDEDIKEGTYVYVKNIKGVKLFVKKIDEEV